MILWLALAALAVYRVAHMVAVEDGPFDAFSEWRERIGQANWIGRGFHCVLCLSWWLAGLAAVWLVAVGIIGWAGFVLTWPGLAGAVLVLHKWSEKL